MISIANLKKSKVFILGAAKSGLWVAKLLKKHGAFVYVSEHGLLNEESRSFLVKEKIEFEEGGHNKEKLKSDFDVLVVSPGILLSTDIVSIARKNQMPIFSEIEVASWFVKKRTLKIGVTGTNGKSTTTHFLSHLFRSAGNNSFYCGNIGTSLSEVLLKEKNIDVLNIELSSYQLESTYSLQFDGTIFLNIQNDHLARYENLENYFKAKWRLVLNTKKDGICILEKEVLEFALKLGLSLPKTNIVILTKDFGGSLCFPGNKKFLKIFKNSQILPISLYKSLKNEPVLNFVSFFNFDYINVSYEKHNNSFICELLNSNQQKKDFRIYNQCLLGEHNSLNLVASYAVAKHLGVKQKILINEMSFEYSKYKPLAHRLEVVLSEAQTVKKITFINDSKATNVESTLVALKSMNRPIRLLLGGEPKGDSYLPFKEYLGGSVVKVYVFGQATQLISHELASQQHVVGPFKNMLAACQKAFEDSLPGEVILLSPACSSLDEFRNFEHRGSVFKEWALSLAGEQKN